VVRYRETDIICGKVRSTPIPDERLSKHRADAVTQFVEFQDIVDKSTDIDRLQVCHYANAIYIKKDH